MISDALRRAAQLGAQMVVFPEAAMSQDLDRLPEIAEPLDGFFASSIRSLVRELGLIAVVGMWEKRPGGHGAPAVANTLLITNGRDVEASYRKIHTYDAFGHRESDVIERGSELITVEALGTTFGFATCYDLRFAQQFVELGRAGAEIVVVPTSWGAGPLKKEQFRTLVRARALDAQAFLVAADQAYTESGGTAPLGVGASVLVSPFCEVLAEAGDEPTLLIHDLDVALVARAREVLPTLFG